MNKIHNRLHLSKYKKQKIFSYVNYIRVNFLNVD